MAHYGVRGALASGPAAAADTLSGGRDRDEIDELPRRRDRRTAAGVEDRAGGDGGDGSEGGSDEQSRPLSRAERRRRKRDEERAARRQQHTGIDEDEQHRAHRDTTRKPGDDDSGGDAALPDQVQTAETLPDKSGGLLMRMRKWLRGSEDPPISANPEREDGQRRERREPETETGTERPPPRRSGSGARPPRSAPSPGTGNAGASARRSSPLSRDASGHSGGGGEGADAAPDQRSWFRPRWGIGAQIHGDHRPWLDSRREAASYGLAYVPRVLPLPYVYGPQTIAARFQSAGQRWLEANVDPAWRQGGEATAGEGRHWVRVRGRIPVGEVLLPVPLFGRVRDVQAQMAMRVIQARSGATVVVAEDDGEVEYTVHMPQAPEYSRREGDSARDDAGDMADILLARAVVDDELPGEVLDFVEHLRAEVPIMLDRALGVRDFIRRRYYYDPSYLESPQVAQWLEKRSRGRSNAHVAVLHAGGDHRYLGRGVCYELNALACEMLRRVEVPAAVATGWTFDRGYIDEPDHMWAMALLPTEAGPRWLPVDASTTRDGRPLHVGRRPPGRWRAPAHRHAPPPPPMSSLSSHDDARIRAFESDSAPVAELMRVLDYMRDTVGGDDGESIARADIRAVLRDPEASRALLERLRELSRRQK